MAQNVYAGLAVTSGSTTSAATATFDSVSMSSSAMTAPSITTITATTGSVGTQVAISGSNFGASEGNSMVAIDGWPMTINAWTASAIAFTIPTGAPSGTLLVSTGPSMNASSAVRFTVTSQALPAEWLDQDIGAVGLIGSAGFANGTFSVAGAGSGLFTSAYSDQIHFAYQPFSGDGSIVARIPSSPGGTGYAPQAGIMIRETLAPGSICVATIISPQASIAMFYRTATDASAQIANSPGPSSTIPYWVKLTRSGSTFTSYRSYDGVTWLQVYSQTISMAQNVYIGLAVTSGSTSTIATDTFDSVAIHTTGDPMPLIASVSATTGSVGSQVTIGGSNFGAS